MIKEFKIKTYNLLRWSEQWTATDMVYLTKGGFWLTLAQIITSLSSFGLAIAFANLVPKDVYGAYKYILSIAGLLGISTLSGVYTAIIQSAARGYEGSLAAGLKLKIKWGLTGGLAGLLLASYYFLQGNHGLSLALLFAACFIPILDAGGIYSALLVARRLFAANARLTIAVNVLSMASIVFTLLLTDSLALILLAYFSTASLLNLAAYYYTVEKYRPNDRKEEDTTSYGKHLSLINVLGTLSSYLDKFLVWHYLGAASVAVYAFALAPIDQISSFLKPVLSLALPKFAANPIEVIKKSLFSKIGKFFLIISLGVIAYTILAPYFYQFFFPQYLESIKYTRYLALILLFFPQKLISTVLQAKAQKKSQYVISIVNSVVRIILYVVLIPVYGLYGLVLANIIPYGVNTVLLVYYFKKL